VAVRVLEEGYDLAPGPDTADAAVVVRAHGEDLEVEATGPGGQRRHAVEQGPPAVRRLEVLHRALMGIEATVGTPSERSGSALAIRASGGTEPLVTALVAAAVADGVRVTMQPAAGDVLVCVQKRGDLAEVGFGPASAGCAPPSVVTSLTDEVDASARDLVLRVTPDLRPPSVPAAPPAEDRPPPAPRTNARVLAPEPVVATPTVIERADELAPLQGPPRAEFRLGMEGGIVSRGPYVDASMRTHVRMGRYDGLGGRLEIGVIPSGGPLLRVVDTILAVGPDWQRTFGRHRRARIHVATTVGADLHTYGSDGATAADVSWVCGLPVSYSHGLGGDTRIHVTALGSVSGVATSHRVGDEVPWARSAWGIGAAVGFSYGWRVE
jgi:hypothetical protein